MSTVHTTVPPSRLRILNLRELGWKENQPNGMGVRGMGGMELCHPSGMRQQGTPRASAKAPRCSQRLLNQHHQQRDKTLPATTQHKELPATGPCHPKNQERRKKLQGVGWPWMAACLTQETAFSLPSSIAHFIILVKNLD